MSHTYTQNTVHLVFSTKDRRKLIPREFKSRLYSYLAGICKQDGIFVHAIDGMEDHVHLLIQIPATLALAKSVNTLKSNSSKWANDEGSHASVAKGLRSFQRKRFQHSCGCPIHPESGIASQENELRNGIPRPIKEAQRGIRSEICLWVGVAPTALREFFFELTQPLRDWANFCR